MVIFLLEDLTLYQSVAWIQESEEEDEDEEDSDWSLSKTVGKMRDTEVMFSLGCVVIALKEVDQEHNSLHKKSLRCEHFVEWYVQIVFFILL